MKLLIQLFFCLFLVNTIYGQKSAVTINWLTPNNLSISESTINVEGATPFFVDESNFTAELISSWPKKTVNYSGAKAIDVILENVSASFSSNIDKNGLPKNFKVEIATKKSRDKTVEVLSFNPLVNSNGVVKRVVSFDFKPTANSVRSAKNFDVPTRSSSVLAEGEWKRFAIDVTGVYKVTASFLESIGVNLSGVNPETIKIYGVGGKPLPYINSENRFYDIPEVPVKIFGGSDGVFSGEDYLLFYAVGTQGYDVDNDTNLNPFSDETYYYVTTGGALQKKITPLVESVGVADSVFTEYDYEAFSEKDLVNIGGLGRKWFGDKFDGSVSERNYTFNIPNPVSGSQVRVQFPFGGVYSSPPTITFESGLINQDFSFNPFNQGSAAYGTLRGGASSVNLDANSEINIKISLDQNGDPSSEVFLDYIRLFAKSNLTGIGKQFPFSNSQQATSAGVSEFRISNAQSISTVWDVTDPFSIVEKTNNSNATLLSLKVPSGGLNEFVAINDNDFYSPRRVNNSDVPNQDLKGNIFRSNTESNDTGEVEYLIITRSDFLSSANRLADFRRKQDGFNVKVVTVDQIYNEFSSGQQDISAIRNFIKYIYDNSKNTELQLKFVCIIGDGSYDYKERIRGNTNIVPAYYATNSISLSNSYISDDFYGIMDANEGGNISRDLMDIAVGRIVAPTPEVANDMVSKTISYYDRESYGTWRNNFLFVCDDVDNDNNGIDSSLSIVLDSVAQNIKTKLTNANVRKIFADAFRQETSAAGDRYPVVKKNILSAFESGVAYMNYFGHGGEDGISGEAIFRASDARELTNRNRLTVFTTLTCELTRFDNPLRETAGEFLFWNKNGGAVALLTTTRNLSFTTALGLNPVLAERLFDDKQNSISIGEALRLAKNDLVSFGDNRLVVYCVGDPALKIAFPKPKIVLAEINGVNVSVSRDTLKALDKIQLKGMVVDENNNDQILSDFNGEIGVVLFDKLEEKKTLGNDGTVTCWEIRENTNFVRIRRCSDEKLFILEFEDIGSQVFNGKATVRNGEFDIEFVLSKNIKLPVGTGKVSFYAQNSQALEDQSGGADILIGGLNTEAEIDAEPPLISLFLNNESFLDGQLVNSTPNLIAKFSDTNGINTAGGVGHDILAIIDGDERNPINLNEFYTTELDDFTKGVVNFRLKDLEPGEHTLKLRASDVFNNVSNQEITFIVGERDNFTVSEVLNYPNPFTSYTEFWFNHTGPQQDVLDVMIQVLTISGRVVTTKFATLSDNTNSYRGNISWDGKDDFGNKVGKGVYVYKIVVKSALTKKTFSKLEKLVVL